MSIPGTSMEEHEQPADDAAAAAAAAAAAHDDDPDDALVPTVQVGAQQMVPVGELIKQRKEAKRLGREMAELRPRVERAEAVGRQLEEAAPLIEQLRNMTPEARQALATGKLPSPVGTAQPEQDREAQQWAEMNGFIDAQGGLDVQRARNNLDWLDQRHARNTQAIIGPVRQSAAAQAVQNLRQQAKGITDSAGVPMASSESIDEAYAMLPPELASQPQVAHVVIGTAMLIDKMKGRTPRAAAPASSYADPVYMEGGGTRRQLQALSAEEKKRAERIGLTEKDLQSAGSALNAGGRGIRME